MNRVQREYLPINGNLLRSLTTRPILTGEGRCQGREAQNPFHEMRCVVSPLPEHVGTVPPLDGYVRPTSRSHRHVDKFLLFLSPSLAIFCFYKGLNLEGMTPRERGHDPDPIL